MKSFFDDRVETYDEHMETNIEKFAAFYGQIAAPFPETDEPVEVLDLGAGTGIELEFIFAKAPNARVTAVDLSKAMLDKMLKKYEAYASQIRTITDSYLTLELKEHFFDFVVSVMSLHHLLPGKKISLYKKLRQSLVPSGAFVEGDWVVSVEEENKLLREYRERMKGYPLSDDGKYHVDVPFSEETQLRALREAGFARIDVIFRTYRSNVVVARPCFP